MHVARPAGTEHIRGWRYPEGGDTQAQHKLAASDKRLWWRPTHRSRVPRTRLACRMHCVPSHSITLHAAAAARVHYSAGDY